MKQFLVTFKEEMSGGTMEPFGPVHVVDVEAIKNDPKVRELGPGVYAVEFGYKPQAIEDMGWMSFCEARSLARKRNAEFIDF